MHHGRPADGEEFMWAAAPAPVSRPLDRLPGSWTAEDVVGLDAWVVEDEARRDGRAFSVWETLALADGQHVLLARERGWTQSPWIGPGGVEVPEPTLPPDIGELVDTTRVVTDGEDDEVDPQPWTRLAEVARRRGIAVTADDLRRFTPSIRLGPPPDVR